MNKHNTVFATVYPALIPVSSQLANVNDVYNAVMVRGDAIGDALFYGKGAGKLPTASAVVADVVDCAKHLTARKFVNWTDGSEGYVENYKNDSVGFYVRMNGGMDIAKATFENASFIEGANGEFAMITETMQESVFDEMIEKCGDFVLSKIRILNI